MVHPIWKNFIVEFSDSQLYIPDDSVDYIISYQSGGALKTIYSGKAWKRPGEEFIKICINEICADWLINTFPSLVDNFAPQEMPAEFVVQGISYAGSYREVARVRFINDWSYDESHNAEMDGLAAPINGHIDARQWLLWTGLDVSEVNAHVTLVDGNAFDVIIPVEISVDFSEDYNFDFSKSVRSAGSGTAVFNLSEWGDVARVAINGVEYHVVNSCARYVLYYVNAYGGWDSLLIEGNHSVSDNLTRHTRETEYDNRSIQNRGVHNYVNEISKTMTLHTSWLSDDESSRMHHLLNSINVFLGDLVTGQMIPVILTNTTTEYKTYKGNGGRLVNYTINVTIAQERIRR